MVTRFIQLVIVAIVIALINYATASPFDSRTLSQCGGTVPGMKDVKSAFKQDAQFCNFWLSVKRINSPISDVQPAAISSACKCITATATPTSKTIKSATPKPTACATKKDPFYSAMLSDIADPKAFCKFWFLDPARYRTVVPGVGPQHLSSICSCITTSPKISSTSHSTVTSTTLTHTTATSSPDTTTAAPAASSTSSYATQTSTSSSTSTTTSQSSSSSSTSSSTSTSASVSQDASSSSSTSSTSESASPTPKSDAAICPALSGDTLVDTSGTSYAMQCDRTYSGTVITGGSRKRQAQYTIENCLTACNGVVDCVAVSVLNGACTMLSDVDGYSSQSGAAAALNEVRAEAAGITESAIPSLDPPASSSSSTSSETATGTSAASDGDSAATASDSTASTATAIATASDTASSSAPTSGDANDETSDSTTSPSASASATSSPSAGGPDAESADTTTSSSNTANESSTATVSNASESTESSSPSNDTQSSSSAASGNSTATVSTSPDSTESASLGGDGSSTGSQSTAGSTSSLTATDSSTATVSESTQSTESSSPAEDGGSSTSTPSAPADSDITSTSSASTTSTSAATSTSSTPDSANALGCTAPSADVIDGLPAAACGTNFDKALNDVLGYYSGDSADLTDVEAAIIPGLSAVGIQKRALTETIQTVAKDAISTILSAAQSVANAIVAALPGDVQNAEAAVADVSSSVAYRAASQTVALKQRNLDSVHKPGTRWKFAHRAVNVPAQGLYPSGLNTGSPATSSTSSLTSSGTAPLTTSSSPSATFSIVVTGTAPTSVANATFFPTGTAPTQAVNGTSTAPAITVGVGTISPLPFNQTTSAMVGTGTAALPTSFAAVDTSVLTSLSSALGTAPTLTPSSNQTVPLSTGAIIPSSTLTAITGFATVSRPTNATFGLPPTTSSETMSVPLVTAPVSTSTMASNHSIVLSTGPSTTPSTVAANQTVTLSTDGLLVSTTSTVALSTGASSGLPTSALLNNATVPSTTLTSTTTSPSSSVPSPSSNATAPATEKVNSAPITITDTTKTLQLQPGSDGSLFVSTTNADVSSLSSSNFVWDQTNDVVFGDSSSRLLHYFPSELTAIGASRLRLAGWGDIPVGASLLNLVPFQTDVTSDPVLVAMDSLGKCLWPFVCGLQGQTNKVFLVDDLDDGASVLEGSDLVYTIVGGVAQNCAPLALTGNGMTGINA